ncbi:YheU family protein [Halopseudomonas xiamenensis]|uniref:YheU family protein n=1 Tax=Halopseudomonas xiamenensis TaxID=157792 RepID=UPI001626CE59|nr:YheU family protein [Halopseudomonas xiamenensis]
MLIPHTLLDPETFLRLLEDFVTRDGTDNGYDASLEQRVERLRRLIERGEVLIVFHPESGDTSLAHRRDVPAELLQDAGTGQD